MEDELAARVDTAVLVEGESGRVAVEALARRRGRQLDAEGLAALCDVAEVGFFARALETWQAGVAHGDREAVGLFVCDCRPRG